jgi:hypothetical protein
VPLPAIRTQNTTLGVHTLSNTPCSCRGCRESAASINADAIRINRLRPSSAETQLTEHAVNAVGRENQQFSTAQHVLAT